MSVSIVVPVVSPALPTIPARLTMIWKVYLIKEILGEKGSHCDVKHSVSAVIQFPGVNPEDIGHVRRLSVPIMHPLYDAFSGHLVQISVLVEEILQGQGFVSSHFDFVKELLEDCVERLLRRDWPAAVLGDSGVSASALQCLSSGLLPAIVLHHDHVGSKVGILTTNM